MFQFPRKFPTFVPSMPDSSNTSDIEVDDAVKADPDGPAPRRKPVPPQWGRFGSRQEKAARWSEEAGQIGELCVHKSGKVTLRLNGDLLYEVRFATSPLRSSQNGTDVAPDPSVPYYTAPPLLLLPVS